MSDCFKVLFVWHSGALRGFTRLGEVIQQVNRQVEELNSETPSPGQAAKMQLEV